MRFPMISSIAFLSVAAAAGLVACSDDGDHDHDHPVTPAADSGTDGSTTVDAGAAADGASSVDGGTGASDTGALDASSPYVLQVFARALSANGHDRLNNVAYDAQGRIVAVGQSCPGVATTDDCASVVVRFLPDGTLDATFGTGGIVTKNLAVGATGEVARGIAIVGDMIVIAAAAEQVGASDTRERDVYLARFDANGALDANFGTGGVAVFDLAPGKLVGSSYKTDAQWGLAADAQGRLYVSGGAVGSGRNDTDFALLRTTPSGARDTTFGTNGVVLVDIANADASGRGVVVTASGVATVCGYMSDASSNAIVPVLFRTTAAGALDATFGVNGVFAQTVLASQAEAYGLAFQGDRVVTNAYGRASTSEELDFVSLRLTGAGGLDSTYGTGGVVRVDVNGFKDQGRSLAVLPDQRLVLVGAGRATAGDADGVLALLTQNGAPDLSFGAKGQRVVDLGGTNDTLNAISLAADGKHAAVVGTRAFAAVVSDAGVDAGVPDDDDSALVLLTLP